jgi:hypothetical protein
LGTKKGLAASEQSSGWKVKRAELGNSEIHHSGSSWTDHAQNGCLILGRSGQNGRKAGDFLICKKTIGVYIKT